MTGRGETNDLPVMAIIGGGLTGVSTAFHLARDIARPARIVVIEPRARRGRGWPIQLPIPATGSTSRLRG